MISTSQQLKAKIHNLAAGKGISPQGLQYIYTHGWQIHWGSTVCC